jgi:PHD/YefM family antitoxin component YafN of YafNO toxin-antitoxin module
MLETVIRGGRVVITRHDAPKAVLISMDEFKALSHAPQTKLNTLSAEFDALLAGMQSPKSRAGMRALFKSSSRQLGKAAVAGARRRS